MSENIMSGKVGFFENKEISNSVKLGVTSLLLGGTFGIYTSPNGKVKTFASTVFTKGRMQSNVFYDLRNPDGSLAPNGRSAIESTLGISVVELSQKTDKEALEMIANKVKELYGLSDEGLEGLWSSKRENIRTIFEALKKDCPGFAEQFDSVNSFLSALEEILNLKKKQQPATVTNGNERETNN
ncbi:MAG: hypothetical protein IJ538_02480 [Clostridia bacterium]|nr:hypothetical protein [Clostridia bacterium]